jgi:hypothetical protein
MTNDPIQHLLDAAQGQLVALDREIVGLQRHRELVAAQIDAYQKARDAVNASITPIVVATKSQGDAPASAPVVRRRAARHSGGWERVMQNLSARYHDGFGYDEIINGAEAVGVPANRASLRTKMMNYTNDGVFERIDIGRFKLTAKGAAKFHIEGASPINENGEAEASPDADEVSTSSTHREELDRLFS